jgi:hypothetical protein
MSDQKGQSQMKRTNGSLNGCADASAEHLGHRRETIGLEPEEYARFKESLEADPKEDAQELAAFFAKTEPVHR